MNSDASRPKPRLPRGTSALDPSERDRLHRGRLQDALVALVAEHGFAETHIRDICAHAQVGPRDLYGQYPGKQELLLRTCDAIADEAIAAVRAANRAAAAPKTIEAAVSGVLVPFAQALAARPQHAELLLIHVFGAGAVGPPYRRGLAAQLQGLLGDALSTLSPSSQLSAPALAIVSAGTLQAFQQRLLDGRPRSLLGAARELAGWAARYRTSVPLPLPPPSRTGSPPQTTIRPLPRNTQRLPRQFVVPHQRDRIVRAVATLARREGYTAMSIPAIAGEAQISLRTFYRHFASKPEAFDAVYDQAFGRLFARAWNAVVDQPTWVDAVREGVRAWLGAIAADPVMAQFALEDVLTAGPEAVAKVDQAHAALSSLLVAGAPEDGSVGELSAYATVAGISSLVLQRLAAGPDSDVLPLAPHLVYAILAPVTGDAEALHASGLAPVPRVIPAPVPTDDGQRIAVAFVRLAAAEGLAHATLEQAAERAGVAPSLAREFFDDETDCALQALDAWSDRTFAAMAAAFASAPRDGALALHRALGAMLAQMASEPEMLRLAVAAVDHLGPQTLTRRTRYATVFFEAIAPSIGPDDPIPTHPRQVSAKVADDVFGVLRRHVATDSVAALPEALPEISYLCVAPFFGPQRAADVAQLPFALPLPSP